MRITDHYGITGAVPFLDVHLARDNQLFLDPSAIRKAGSDPMTQRAQRLLLGFFGEVLRCRRSSSPADQTKGLDLLRRLHEPNETRLGMSATKVAGHGWGDELGERLWNELDRNPACRATALSRPEDLALFIDRVGDDLISDLTTRVVSEVLADFTQRMVTRYPALAAAQTTALVDVWDEVNLD